MTSHFPSQNDLTWQGQGSNTCPMDSTNNPANEAPTGPFVAIAADGTLSTLIDEDHPLWCGPDSMLAPHLPVGSPEREALFAVLRETFAEDWAAAERAVEQERREKLGDLYFVRVGEFIKIGRTTNFPVRLRMIACHAPTEPEVLGIIRGGGHLERGLHRTFRHLRAKGEWFQCDTEIEAEINRLATTPMFAAVL